MSAIFKFKKFSVKQDATAMKIGTDAVLLGAWVDIEETYDTLLDVGSGTGVIALMLAQRSFAMTIDAVEIDANAYEQSVDNFENSEWGDRLYCYHSDFKMFAKEFAADEETYDLIVSNPPFYTEDYETDSKSRNTARFTSALSFEDLINGVATILAKNGNFCTIIPAREKQSFIAIAQQKGLYLNRICYVKGTPNTEVKRVLLSFSFADKILQEEHLTIELARHHYTQEYTTLTKDFYLKM